MRCLYCGKELALLKRLTGGGDFCSDTHKQSYQEEYNRLALSRLLQAQNKGPQANKSPAPPPVATVALEEPVPELEESNLPVAVPVLEVSRAEAHAEIVLQAAPEVVEEEEEESSSEEVVEPEAAVSEPEPVETAGFILEGPALATPPEETPYLETPYVESWLELSSGPAMSEWQLENGTAFTLSSADLLALDVRLDASSIEYPAPRLESWPQAFAGVPPNPPVSAVAKTKKAADADLFPMSGAIAIDTPPTSIEPSADLGFVQGIEFENAILIDASELLELPPGGIDYPAEDSDVAVLAGGQSNSRATVHPEAEPEVDTKPEAEKDDDSPRGSLEALSRLHQELVEHDAATTEAIPEEIVEGASNEAAAPPETALEENQAADTETVEAEVERKPKFTTELFEFSIKTFPPAKPAPMGSNVLPGNVAPLLPHLNSLPSRPKVALAPDYVPPSAGTPQALTTAPAAPAPSEAKQAKPTSTPLRAKPPASGKPAARLTQPKQPAPAAKPLQSAATKVPEPAAAAQPKAPSPKADATKPVVKTPPAQPVPSQVSAPETQPVEKEPAANPAPAASKEEPPSDAAKPESQRPPVDTDEKTAVVEKPAAVKEKPAAKEKPAVEARKPVSDSAKPAADQANKDNVPNFGIAQPTNNSWLSSLKIKLGLAIVILVIACVYFLGWGGGKSQKPGTANSSVSADGSGPSIIMGEGGWVEGWGGDPAGQHAGRQITIYRPSLKLSDYRLEFQGSIDSKSVGWVFRAADPENYYAMKLMTVSAGLSPKVALFKYLVANGKQNQVGRVPIDLSVQQDTVFNVRVDVRGPQFTTYIQGQQVDSWTDDQLKIGGAGFLNERDERGKVKSVSIRYLSGTAK